MGKKKKDKKRIFTYECTLTGERFKRTAEVKNTDNLVCVNAYYELHPDEDDRPLVVKKQLGISEE